VAFDAGAIEARLTVDTSAADRDLDTFEARVRALEGDHRVKITADLDTSSLGRARQMFADLDNSISKDAMNRLRSSPQGSVLGALNALFSPHPVTGAPSAQQAASQGLLGQMVGDQGSGGTLAPGTSNGAGENTSGSSSGNLGGVLNQAQNESTTDDVRQVLQGNGPADTSTTDDIRQVLEGSTPGNLATTDDIRQVLEGSTPGNLSTTDDIKQVLEGASPSDVTTTDKVNQELAGTGPKDTTTTDVIKQELEGNGPKDSSTTDTVKEKLDPSSAAKTEADAKASGGRAGTGWGSAFSSSVGGILSGLFGGGGGGGEGGGGGGEDSSFLDEGLLGGIGPGILGISTLKASLTGLVSAAVAALPALGGVAAGLTAVAGGAALLFTSNSQLKAQASSLLDSLKSEFTAAAAPMIKPLQDALTSLGQTFKSVGPEVGQIFSAAAPLIMPLTAGLEGLVTGLLPGLLTILKSVAPAMDVFDQFIADVGKDLGVMFADFAPAVADSSVILKALLGVVTGLFPVLGELGSTLTGVLGPAFTAFAGAIGALMPFLSGIAQIVGQFAGAVLEDLGGALQLVASLLKTVSPAFDTLATTLGNVFSTLESKGGFAQLGDVLEGLAAPLGNLVTSLVTGLAPAIPPLLTLFSDFVNVASSVAVTVLSALIPPLTQLAATALGALVAVLPVVVPLVTSLLTSFTTDAGNAIVTIGTAVLNLAQVSLDALLQAAQPLIPVILDLVTAFTPLLNVLTSATASTIAALASALAAIVTAIPSGVLTGVSVAVLGIVGGFKLWGTAVAGVSSALKALDVTSAVSGIASLSGEIGAFAAAAEGATLAEKGMLAGELLMEAATPFGWVVAGGVALVGLVALLRQTTDAAQSVTTQFAQQDDATGYNISGYQKLALQLEILSGQYQKLNAAQYASDPEYASTVANQLSAAAQAAAATAETLQARLTSLSQGLGVSQTVIEQWASAAGVSATKFASSGENVQDLTDKIVTYVNKNASAVTSTASLATNIDIFGNDVFSATTQLDAFNGIWNTLVGNLLTKQMAVSQSASAFQSLQASIKQNGTASTATAQSFQAYIEQIGSSVSTLLKQGTSIGSVNSYLQGQISNLKTLGPLNKSQQADLNGLIAVQASLANSTKGLSANQLTYISQVEGHVIPDLQKMHADTPLVNTDIANLANSIAQTGTKSASTESDRAQLIKDLESAGATAQQATTLVNGLTTSLGKVPKSVTSGVAVRLSGSGSVTAVVTAPGVAAVQGGGQMVLETAAAGGYVSGPGGPTDDVIPALLSNGEYVIQASSVDKYGKGFLDELNAQRFASGGIADLSAAASFADSQANAFTSSDSQAFVKSLVAAYEAAAKAAAAKAAANLKPTGSGATVEALMQSMAASVGWTGAEWTALAEVEAREAGFSLTATNPSSGAYGLAQFIDGPSEYAQYGGNSTTAAGQITAMLNYISSRYGDPIAAEAHEVEYGWYDNGGYLKPGYTLAYNGTGRPEPVTPAGAGGASISDLSARLDQLHADMREMVSVTRQVPAGVGQHVGSAINGAAQNASFRSRYPR
jgi:hypothetical protein